MGLNALSKYADVAEVLQKMTQQVFSTMLGMEMEPGVVDSDNAAVVPDAGIVAMVGIAGAVSGNVCIRLSNPLACELASKLLMAEYEQVDADVLDAIAEIANMIVGGLKTDLEDRFGAMALSLPTVISAERYIARRPALGDRFTITHFCTHNNAQEPFMLQLCLISERSGNNYLRELAELHVKLS